jgi:hypothetical protein
VSVECRSSFVCTMSSTAIMLENPIEPFGSQEAYHLRLVFWGKDGPAMRCETSWNRFFVIEVIQWYPDMIFLRFSSISVMGECRLEKDDMSGLLPPGSGQSVIRSSFSAMKVT